MLNYRTLSTVFTTAALTLVVAWVPIAFQHVEIPHSFWGDGAFGWAWIPLFLGLAALAHFKDAWKRKNRRVLTGFGGTLVALTAVCVVGLFFGE